MRRKARESASNSQKKNKATKRFYYSQLNLNLKNYIQKQLPSTFYETVIELLTLNTSTVSSHTNQISYRNDSLAVKISITYDQPKIFFPPSVVQRSNQQSWEGHRVRGAEAESAPLRRNYQDSYGELDRCTFSHCGSMFQATI